jgi:hypothetical protein
MSASGGNVGIGTASPSGFDVYNKEINQTFRADSTNIHRNNKYYIDSRDTSAPNTITTRYAVSAADDNGASAERSELVLGATADENSPIPGSSFISFSDSKKLYLGSHPDADFMSDWSTVTNQAYPRMGSNTFAPHVTLLPSGNVGIGTTTPYAKLHVYGSDGAVSSASRSYFYYGQNVITQSTAAWGTSSIYASASILTKAYFVSHNGTSRKGQGRNLGNTTRLSLGETRCFRECLVPSDAVTRTPFQVTESLDLFTNFTNPVHKVSKVRCPEFLHPSREATVLFPFTKGPTDLILISFPFRTRPFGPISSPSTPSY